MSQNLNIALFAHSMVSDWNHGNAHFLRGLASELVKMGHEVRCYEERDGWSITNLAGEGAEAVSEALADFRRAFPDLDVAIQDIFGHDGRVGVRALITGTHRGEWFGIAPTGRPVRLALHEFHQLRDGRISHTWHLEDWFGMLQQVGAWPPAPAAAESGR